MLFSREKRLKRSGREIGFNMNHTFLSAQKETPMRITPYYCILLTCLCFIFPDPVFSIEFEEFNDYLGVCPVSQTITHISRNGSYDAYVNDSKKFAKICPEIKKGTRIMIKKLDAIHWLVQLDEKEIRFRFEDVGYKPTRWSKFRVTKICDMCPKKLAGK